MPELPEVETALRGISPYLKNFTIEKVVVRQPKLRWAVSEELIDHAKKCKNCRSHSSRKIFDYSHGKRLYHRAFGHVRFGANCATE